MAFISIDYKEFSKAENLDYKSVNISYNGSQKRKSFNSGDFVKDWFDCNMFIILELDNEPHFSNSSTVDHFIMDGAKFDSAYLGEIEGIPTLIYEKDFEGIEFFVKQGTKPTWEELKTFCSLI